MLQTLDELLLTKQSLRLKKIFILAASPETSCDPITYKKKRKKYPLALHCGAVATTIHGMFGGDIVTGRVKGEPHYWNRLPSGQEVDFTSCQFGGDGFTPFKKGRKVTRKGLTNPRFLLFAQRVLEILNEEDNHSM